MSRYSRPGREEDERNWLSLIEGRLVLCDRGLRPIILSYLPATEGFGACVPDRRPRRQDSAKATFLRRRLRKEVEERLYCTVGRHQSNRPLSASTLQLCSLQTESSTLDGGFPTLLAFTLDRLHPLV